MTPVTELHEPEVQAQTPHVVGKKPSSPLPLQPTFFADILLEVDSYERRRRRWAAVSSVIVQSLVIGGLLLIPLMFTEVLPKQQLLTFLVAPPPPPPPPPPAAAPTQVTHRVQSNLMDGRLRTPSRIPTKVQMIREEEPPPPAPDTGGVVGGIPGGIPGGQLGGVIGGIISSKARTSIVPRLAPPPAPKRIKISQGITKGMLIQRVDPQYPRIALAARIQGVVLLSAIISKAGTIENLVVVSGHPLLVPTALAAVKQWRYRPFFLNGEPVEVETTIAVTFQFGQ